MKELSPSVVGSTSKGLEAFARRAEFWSVQVKQAVGLAAPWKGTSRMNAVQNVKRRTGALALAVVARRAVGTKKALEEFMGDRGKVTLGTTRIVRFDRHLHRAEIEINISVKGSDKTFLKSVYQNAQRRVGYMVSQPIHYE